MASAGAPGTVVKRGCPSWPDFLGTFLTGVYRVNLGGSGEAVTGGIMGESGEGVLSGDAAVSSMALAIGSAGGSGGYFLWFPR